MSYRALDSAAIVATAERLSARIGERFPDSGLSKVAREVLAVTRETDDRIATIRRPRASNRLWVWATIALGAALIVALVASLPATSGEIELFPLLQIVESGINDVVFLGIAVVFLLSLEARKQRRDALRALHQLRSLAHVIDMHQLTKDPDHLLSPDTATASSPRRELDRFGLSRYLDYCSELLSILSKVAALYAQDLDDREVLAAVNDIQTLTAGLSSKIWQKLVILDNLRARG